MVYIVEDDDNIRELVAYTLNTTGIEAKGFSTPSEFLRAMDKELPRLILLDIMLPERDGLSILKSLKEKSSTKNIPVMMVSAKGTEFDKVRGLDLGADDYMHKPFGMMELVARVKALLRRTEKGDEPEYTIGALYVCPSRHKVTVNGAPVELTLKEFELLCLLLKNTDVVITREQLLDTVWGYDYDGENRTVDVHIHTLRNKLGEAGEYIRTVRGIGYKIGGREIEG